MQMSALLLRWGSYRWARNLWGLIIYLFFLPVMLPSAVPRLARLVFGNFSFFKTPFPGCSSIPPLCLSLCLLYFFLPHFEDNGLFFWVPDVLCQHSEVVLYNLLSVEVFF